MPWVQAFLVKYPELAVYLTVAIGYVIGRLRIACIGLGPVTGSLFAGMLIGQFAHVPVSSMAKSFLFLLFLFGIGYSVGPQFMESLKRDGIKPVLLAVVVCVTGLATATSVARFLGLDPGFAAGLLSGALTESPAMGNATEAINALPLPAADRTIMVSHVAVADAVCYLFGAFFVILFCSQIGPKLLRVDLREEALRLERAYGIERGKAGLFSAWRRFELRAYRSSAVRVRPGTSGRWFVSLLVVLMATFAGVASPARAQTGTDGSAWREFQGIWTAVGHRETLRLGGDRRASISDLDGSLMLSGASRPALGFRAEAIVFNDSATGMVGRAVWTDDRGDQAYSELRSEGDATGNRIVGTFVGGTGRYASATGTYEFSWRFLLETEDGTVQGQSEGLKGRVRTNPQPSLPGTGGGRP